MSPLWIRVWEEGVNGILKTNWIKIGKEIELHVVDKLLTWVKDFRINPEFRILRLTFHRKSASKC